MIRNICLLFLLCNFAFAKAQQTPTIYQRAEIKLTPSNTYEKLIEQGIVIDHAFHKKGVAVVSEFSKESLDLARNLGYEVSVLINDVKASFLSRNNNTAVANPSCSNTGDGYTTPANFNQGSMGGYLTYQEMLDELADMKTQYPNLITAVSDISNFLTEGTPDNSTSPSIGSNGIKWVKISDNPDTNEANESEILYTSIHHAREPMSLMQNIFYMWYLLENYDTDAQIQAIVDNTELYFIPVVNPDGYLYNEKTDPNGGGFWRKNRKNGVGVDNNRNYDYHINGNPANGSWGGPGSSSNPNSQTYHGTGPFSEVENQAVKWFVEQHNFVIAINNHSFGNIYYYPFGYADVATPDDTLFQGFLTELGSENNYDPVRDSPFAGDSDDFMYGTVGTHSKIFSFTPEIGSTFWPNASQIESICKGMMYSNITAAQMTNNYASIAAALPTFLGEATTINLPFDIRRLGINGTGNFSVGINPISSNITSVDAPVTFTGLAPLETANGSFNVNLNTNTVAGELVAFDIVVNNGSYDLATRIESVYGTPEEIFNDNGDSNTANFESNSWGTTTSTFVSPSSSITDSPGGNYSNNTNKTIALSNTIDLSDASIASASFYARWDIEAGWDYVQFEISADGGNTWEPQCGLYTSNGNSNQAENQPLYDGVQSDWILEQIDLSDYIGSSVLARFQLVSDGGVQRDGFYFDDLKFEIITGDPLSAKENIATPFTVFPNPVTDYLTIQSLLEEYTTTVFNIQGQRLLNTQTHSNNSQVNYSSFPKGIYFMQIESENGIQTIKIIKQ